jgi:AcrR family transcriptional regulator
MARPLSVTDDEVLEASERVAARVGTHSLTVSEVAREVGLTRAAITLRFAGADALKRLVMERKARRFEERIAAIDLQHGASGLLSIAEMLGGMLKGREQAANFWLRYSLDIDDPAMRGMEERRGHALRALIAGVMPETAIEKSAAVETFMALMTGSMLNWQTSDHPDASAFLRKRALDWIRLARIPVDEAVS